MNRSESLTQSILDLINNPEDKIKQQPRPPYREVQSMEAEEDIVQKTLEEMNRISDSIPTFHYPFKRRSNTATKTKSDQEIFEEILFKDKTAQYLFNSSGLFHGGVHLKAEEFEMDFEVESIRAIADGELVYYRIDKKYLKNRLEDSHNEFDVLYSTGFFLLEHKMEYPKGNRLKFYSLYMHTAPSYDYEFEEYVVMGASAYARKTSDNSKADDFVKFGDRVVLGKPIPNKDGRYELLTVNGIKMPSGFNVHISNLQYEAVITSVTGSKPNMRKGNTSKSPSEGLLKDKSSITVHPYQTEEQKKNKRYKVLKAIKADGTEAVVGSKSTIHATNIKAKIPEVHIYTKSNNGIVQPHMKEMAGTDLKPASKDFKVKAGEELGKLGVYNSEWYETELDKVIHLEVFTFDDLKTFIEKAKEEYKKPIEDLSDEEKKLRPKENQLFIKKDVTRYVKESYTYAKLTEADWLRDKTVKNTKTDKTLNVLKVNKKPQKIKKDSILKINPTKDGRRYKVISVEEGDSEVQSVISSDTSEKWSVYEKSIEIFHGFNEIPKEVKQYYVNVCKPLKTLKKLKDKEGTEYIQIDKIANIEIYVKDDEKYKTHGITFPNFTLIDEAGADKIGIFEEVSKYYEKNTKEEKTPQEDKEKLNDTFKAILQKLKIDKNKNGRLEAGEFASLSLTKEKRKELSYMMVKHTSEWEYEKEKFQPILDYLDQDPKQEKNKKMFEDRLEKLAFFPKDIVGEGKTPTFIHPIALVEGFVGGEECISLKEAKEIALKVSGGYEGKNPSYSSLAKNFDGAGMSWGIIQWNFGQDTLGPLLRKMRQKNILKFNNCFASEIDLKTLNTALNGTSTQQFNWSINMQNNHNERWKNIFNNLASIPEFQEIQLKAVEVYDTSAITSIKWMRLHKPNLMSKIDLVTFVALHDLAVQQGGLNRGNTKINILSKIKDEIPTTQQDFLKIVIKERGNLASSRWRADCISRRMGIINKKKTKIIHTNITAERDNKNFNLIKKGFICDL